MLRIAIIASLLGCGSAVCKDDHLGLTKAAQQEGHNDITHCSHVAAYCQHGKFGPIIRRFCPKTCGVCPAPAPAAPAAGPAPAPAPPASSPAPASGSAGACAASWSCPASWSTSASPTVPSDTPDAKAFIAVNNIYRCMHDVGPVQWDDSVYQNAKKWSQKTNGAMTHSHSGTAYRASSDGENLAGTFKHSKHRGVDATHMWYSEIGECSGCAYYSTSKYGKGATGHFTAMIWKTMSKIAYSDTTTKLAVGQYRGCDGKPPNFNSAYAANVPPPKHNFADCAAKVKACPAFSDIDIGAASWGANGIEGCKRGTTANSKDSSGNWIWKMKYASASAQTCAAKYDNILSEVKARLDEETAQVPVAFLMASPGPLAIASGIIFAAAVVMIALRRARARGHEFKAVCLDEVEDGAHIQLAETGALIASEDGSME